MLIYSTAILAAARVAGKNRSQVVIIQGPPLWRLLLAEVADGLASPLKWVSRLLGSSGRTDARCLVQDA